MFSTNRTLILLMVLLTTATPCLALSEAVVHSEAYSTDGTYPVCNLLQGPDGNYYGTTLAGGTTNGGTVFEMNAVSHAVTILHNFGDGSVPNDGEFPNAGLIRGSDGDYYGTTFAGGAASDGTIFEINASTRVLTVLHSFGASSSTDGSSPNAGLIMATDGNYYGTTSAGGTAGEGTVFVLNTTTVPASVTVLHSFGDGSVANDGSVPFAGLIQGADGNLYGDTTRGGSAGAGAVFVMNFTSHVVTTLHSFGDGSVANDGSTPYDTLVQGKDDYFYGTTSVGGAALNGAIFRMSTTGIETILHSFGDGTVVNDGLIPEGGLIQSSSGTFYGTTSEGGFADEGTIFSVTSTGGAVTVHSFGDGTVANDGLLPGATLVQGSDGNIYGTASQGGSGGSGAIFELNSSSGIVTTLHSFTVANDMDQPNGLVVGADDNFYGTSVFGGEYGDGTIFKMNSSTNAVNAMHTFGDGTVLNDGIDPYYSTLVKAADGNLYGTTSEGGTADEGTIFMLDPTTGVTTILHSFGDGSVADDGATPYAALVQGTDGNFYGTTYAGGSAGGGVFFEMDAYSNAVTIIHSFGDGSVYNDGLNPSAPVMEGADGNFYGTTVNGGAAGFGTLFQWDYYNHGWTTMHNFGDGTVTNDGLYPYAGLVQDANQNLYGTTFSGGSIGDGTVFELNFDTVSLSVLHSFHDGSVLNDGIDPTSALLLASDGNFYGTTSGGGTAGDGTAFELTAGTWGLTLLHSFGDGSVAHDGMGPQAALIQGPDGNLYGTTFAGGIGNTGAIYELYNGPPTGLTAVAGDHVVTLSWLASPGATSYNLYRGTTTEGESTTPYAAGVTSPIYTDCGVTNGITYYYTVAAVDTLGTSSPSNEASATPMPLAAPPVPTGFTAAAGTGQVTLSWAGSTGATSYSLYWEAPGWTAYRLLTSTTIFSYTQKGLINGDEYSFEVAAVGPGGASANSAPVTATPLAAPSGLTATFGVSQVVLSWSASAGATSYDIYRGTSAAGESTLPDATDVKSTSFTDYGLTNGIKYYYKIAGVNANGTSGLSNEAAATPEPPIPLAPTGLTATLGNALVSLSWTASAYATSYNIYRGTATGGEGSTAIATGVTAVTYTNTGLTNGSTYYYKVAAVDASGTSPLSTEASATPQVPIPPAPTGLTATAGNALVILSWTTSSGAVSYDVYLGTATGGESATPAATGVTTTSFTSTGLTNGTTYFYKLSAVNPGGTSPLSNEASAKPVAPPPSVPTGVTAVAGSGNVTISWTASSATTSYIVDWLAPSWTSFRLLTTTTGLTYTQSGLIDGDSYSFEVAAVGAGGTSAFSAALTAVPLGTPSGLTATAGIAQVSLSWAASNGATAYDVFRGTAAGGESTTPVATVTSESYTDSGLTNGVKYYYKVAGVNSSGTSAFSGEASATPTAPVPSAPTGLTATTGNTLVILTWTGSAYATSYSIFRGTAAGGEGSTAIVTGVTALPGATLSYSNTGLTNGKTYYYKVAAVDASGTSPLSNEASATPQVPIPPSPTGLTATLGNTLVSLSWTASSGAATYDVYLGTSTGTESTTPIATGVGGTTFTDTGLTNGTTYFFKVSAVNAGGTSPLSNEASATPQVPAPLVPTGVKATSGNVEITITWTASTWATSYTVIWEAPGWTAYRSLASTTALTYTIAGVTNGDAYSFEVEAVSPGGTSPYSAPVTATPIGTPTGLETGIGNNVVALYWTASAGASSYNVYRGTTSGGESATPLATGVPTTTYTDSGLTNGVKYFYKVAAVNATGTSPLSAEVSAIPDMPTSAPYPGGTASDSLPSIGLSLAAQAEFTTGEATCGTNRPWVSHVRFGSMVFATMSGAPLPLGEGLG